MPVIAKANLVFTAADQKQLTDDAIAVCLSLGIDKSELLIKTLENFLQGGKITAKDAARQFKIFEKHRQTKIALVVLTLRDKKKGSPSKKFMATLSDLSLTIEDRIMRKSNLTPEQSLSQAVFDPHAIEKIDLTKNKWMSVFRKKEQLTSEFTEIQKRQLGDNFSKEREANKRLKEDKEIRDHHMNEKNSKWKEVLSKKQKMDKQLNLQLKALETENNQKIEESARKRSQMMATQTFFTQTPEDNKSLKSLNNSFRMTQFQFVDRGKLDREQSFQEFAQATQILNNKENQIEMARVQREQELQQKKDHIKIKVDRAIEKHESVNQRVHEESEENYKNVIQRRYEISQQISRAQQEQQELVKFKKDENQKKLVEARERHRQIKKEVETQNRAKFKSQMQADMQFDKYQIKPLSTILEQENDIRIEMNEDKRESVRQNLQRRQHILSQYKSQLIQDVINKKNRCASLGRQREEIVNHSMENNRSIRQEFIQVQTAYKQQTKPVPFETHYQVYDQERRRKARVQAEGKDK